eukprot:13031898-Ditylum_brightwellii.AAC.1
MVVTRWKDSRVLHTISTVTVKGATHVQQWTGWEVETIKCHNDICEYQDGMGTVDKGNQHRALGAAFVILHTSRSADELAALQCGGVVHRKMLIKWEFYSVA